MRKILIILPMIMLSCFLQGCRRHVYHTYYGDIDIDTMQACPWDKEGSVYKIHVIQKDTIYFKPFDKTYYKVFPTNDEHGNCVVQWNPYTGDCEANW